MIVTATLSTVLNIAIGVSLGTSWTQQDAN